VRWLESLFLFDLSVFVGVGSCAFSVPLFLVPYLYFSVPMAGPLVIHRIMFDLFTYVRSYFYFECCVQLILLGSCYVSWYKYLYSISDIPSGYTCISSTEAIIKSGSHSDQFLLLLHKPNIVTCVPHFNGRDYLGSGAVCKGGY
jgi:hypothetical protein